MDVPIIHTNPQPFLKERGFFYVGGEYFEDGGTHQMMGQMYVEVYVPAQRRHKYPLILIHGAQQTGLCFLSTPDGRPGWVDYFLQQGFVVYVIDQVSRGRSCTHEKVEGKRKVFSAEEIEAAFTASQGNYPQASLHTQWPGTGKPGDPVFDAFYASQVDSIYDIATTQRLNRAAGKELLQQTGPAILLTHSQGGPIGWQLADDQPELVKGIVSVEPSGPPFVSAQTGKLLADENGRPANYGISQLPLAFDPPVSSSGELELSLCRAPRADWVDGYLQKEPARKLPHLAKIPVVVLTSESSYHARYDYWTARFLQQAQVPAEYLPLESAGIHGNGHMMMLEKNNGEIAALIGQWIEEHVPEGTGPNGALWSV